MTHQKKNKKNMGINLIGSVLLAAGVVIVLPKLINAVSSYIFTKRFESNYFVDAEEDCGPKIIRK